MRRRSVQLSDEDFLEGLITLAETLVAFEMALLPYLWQHASPAIEGELERLSRDWDSRLEQIRFLAGLSGFVRVEIEQHDSALEIAMEDGAQSDHPLERFHPTVAAIFSLWDEAQEVRVNVRGVSTTFQESVDRRQMPLGEQNPWIKMHMTALLIRHSRIGLEGPLLQGDVDHALFPAAVFIDQASRAFLDAPAIETARDVETYLEWLEASSMEWKLSEEATDLAGRLSQLAGTLKKQVRLWRAANSNNNERLARQAMRTYRRALLPLAGLLDDLSSRMK